MIALSQPAPLDQWRQQFGGRRHRPALARPVASLGYLRSGPAIEGLIEIDKLVFVVLFDDPDERGRSALRLAGFSGRRIPWGVRWGGPEQSKFFKNLLLQPMPGARGLRLDTTSADLLRLGLQLDRDVQRHIRYGRRFKRPQVRLPRLWAGFRAADAATITGDGPELEAYGRHTGRSPDDLLKTVRRSHFGLTLFPFPWASHHWQQAVAVFADLNRYPQRQVFPLHRLPDDLVGCQQVAEYDFFNSRFRLPSADHSPGSTIAVASV